MQLSLDKTQIVYNDFLTLSGIPTRAFEYKLGNHSALQWLLECYQVKKDKRTGIINDPNSLDQPKYILSLIQKIITVCLKTLEIVEKLKPRLWKNVIIYKLSIISVLESLNNFF